MPRPAKGPRLYLREGRIHPRTGKPIPDVWFIRDGSHQVSTGCGRDGLHGPDGAEAKLGEYIRAKWAEKAPSAAAVSAGDPAGIPIATVLAFYGARRVPKLARPQDTASRCRILLEWWGGKTLDQVKLTTCEDYVAYRTGQTIRSFKPGAKDARRCTDQGARRELEDLSAAIGFYKREHRLDWRPTVTMPTKAEGSKDALSRSQAASMLKASMGWRWVPDHVADDGKMIKAHWKRLSRHVRTNRAHLRRFLLIGLYTGTRPGVMPKLLWEEAAMQAWVDLDAGIIWRRGRREREHKTKKRTLVKMPPRLLAHMRRWKRLDDKASDAAAKAAQAAGDDAPEPLTSVLHHGGAPITGKIRTAWESAVRDAGLPADVSPHWLRHTAATWLLSAGVPAYEAAEYLGMTSEVLKTVYAHVIPDHQARARKAMGGKR